ncbi:MAG: UDP-3-O-(3-hydroxymyristoyl)glucosamine N-acyltransferase [Spirochaetota bacterium]|nr:MAG: UDP-3-O-(3-hydroxymyristoyl)glucosamine N-acyltransferase [Spirochaetota bacterium]
MYTVGYIAEKISGRVVGNEKKEISEICSPENIKKDSIVFIKDKRMYDSVEQGIKSLCVVVDFEPVAKTGFDYIVVKSEQKDQVFIKLLSLFEEKELLYQGISGKASIAEGAEIGKDVAIDDFVKVESKTVIGDRTSIGAHCAVGPRCKIGKDCIIYPNVTIYADTIIGDRVIIHSGVIIGADGYSYANIGGKNKKIPQIGGVLIENDVEIGANSTIDRATLGYTKIGENTKIDNIVQIAHNVEIGKNSIICALCGISGSVKIGNNVVLAGMVGLADHIKIEDDVFIGAKSGVMEKVVKKGSKLLGYPALDYASQLKNWAVISKLKQVYSDLNAVKKKVAL